MSAEFAMAFDEHISDEIFDLYEARKTTPAEMLTAQTHVARCETCREKMARVLKTEKSFAAVHNNFAFEDFGDEPEHLPYEQLEFFVDNKLDEVDREIAESHLAICGECAKDLADLNFYREISAAPLIKSEIIAEPQRQSFWRKLFAFDSIGSFAPVAAVLLVAVLFGAWFLLRDNLNEIAQSNINKSNSTPSPAVSNFNSIINSMSANTAPENSPPSNVAPSLENLPENQTLLALTDANGQITVDEKGNVKGLENLSPAAQKAIEQTLKSGKVSVSNAANSLGGNSGILMGEADENGGVPFALQTPIGKVIKENQPVLRWKPLKDAASYSAAIVDEKFRVVEQSGKLTGTSWKPSKPLPRGANYSWQVTAIKTDGTETVSPSSPAPQARFRVVEQNLFDEINRLEKSGKRSHLALGVLYAKAGLKREARIEFEKLARENPDSTLARKLLQSVK